MQNILRKATHMIYKSDFISLAALVPKIAEIGKWIKALHRKPRIGNKRSGLFQK